MFAIRDGKIRSFLVPRARRGISSDRLSTVSIIPVPFNLGQPSMGLDSAPQAILNGGLKSVLGDIGWRVKHLPPAFGRLRASSDVEGAIHAKNCATVGTVSEMIKKCVEEEVIDGNFPLILGGDHAVAIGSISGIKARRPNNAIVWVDAHADINTPDTTFSGNMHGMPLGFLLGLVRDVKSLPNFHWFSPSVKPTDIVYIGLRDVDSGEKKFIKDLGIRAYSMLEVDKLGIGKVMEETLDYIGNRDIHLSFDIDAMDPSVAPHTGTSVIGGLSFREGNFICESLAETSRLTSMELVEVDPSLQKETSPEKTIDCAVALIASAMGKRILLK